MATGQPNSLVRHIRRVVQGPDNGDVTDGELLKRFVAGRDEEAFATLVERYAPLVFGVCRRVLHHQQDAEDAFQATFLVFLRRAGAIKQPELLGNWLYGVAYLTARNARVSVARRQARERQATEMPQPLSVAHDQVWRELRPLLDEELSRLPEKYRLAVVLCDLQGKSRKEVALHLGCPEGTVSSRLTRARQLLRARLTRRGLTLSAGALTIALTQDRAAGSVPPGLLTGTIKTLKLVGAARAPAAGVFAPQVAALAEGVLKAMFLSKLKIATALLAAIVVLTGAGLLAHRALALNRGQESGVRDQKSGGQTGRAKASEAGQTVTVKGLVLDPAGKPVGGARLYLPRRKENPQSQHDVALIQRGTTERNGHFELKLPRREAQPGPVPLVAVADGYGLAWVDLPEDGPAGDLTLRLVNDVPIRGRIITPEGKPVTRATITVPGLLAFERLDDFLRVYQREISHADEGTGTRPLRIPLTALLQIKPCDQDGWFEIRGIGAERLAPLEVTSSVYAGDTMLIVTRPGFDPRAINQAVAARATPGDRGRGRIPVLCGPAFEHVAVLTRPIEGTIREAGSGKPVAGATIQMFGNSTQSDDQGHYVLRGLRKAEEYVLQVNAPEKSPLIGRWIKLSGAAGLEPIQADIELPRGVVITGRVLDKATRKGIDSSVHFSPLPENPFALKDATLSLSTFTQADGRFRLVTIPGPGVLLAAAHGTAMKIEGVPIYPYKPAEFDAEDRRRVTLSDALKPFHSFVGAGGGLEPLEFSNACKVLDVKESGEPVTCNLLVDPGKTLTVHLQDPEGKPLTGVLAAGLSAQALRAVPLRSATCPVFALDPDKPRQLVFIHGQRKLAAAATVRGDEKEPVTVRLAPGGALTGRVLDGDGQPLAAAEVHVIYAGQAGQQLAKDGFSFNRLFGSHTAGQGHFRLEGIVPGLDLELRFVKGRQVLVPATKLDKLSVESGKTLELGGIRTKARTE